MADTTGEVGSLTDYGRDFRRRIAIIASLFLIFLAAGAAISLVQGVNLQLERTLDSYDIRRNAREWALGLAQAESAQRGFLLTHDKRYLAPFDTALADADRHLAALVGQLADNEAQSATLAALALPYEDKKAEMASTITFSQAGDTDAALKVLNSDAGVVLMERLRDGIEAFISSEDDLLYAQNNDVSRSRQLLILTIILGLSGGALLASALLSRSQRRVTALSRQSNALLGQNEELEQHVAARTVELEEARQHSERERERVETLLRDTNHRIGNSLATVSSLLALQMMRSDSEEVKAALEAARDRVHAIASGHRRLRLGDDLESTRADDFLDAVVEDFRETHAGTGAVKVISHFAPAVINARDATSIGIIVGELLTNALKHGFANGRAGTISVATEVGGDAGFQLSVEDDGHGFASPPAQGGSGLGSIIVKQLASPFGGEPHYEPRSGGGTRFVVQMPQLKREAIS